MFWSKYKLEATWFGSQICQCLFGFMGRVIVQHDTNVGIFWIVLVQRTQEFHKFIASMLISNDAMHHSIHEVNARKEGHNAMPLVLMVARMRTVAARDRRQIWREVL